MAIDPECPTTLYAGTEYFGIFKSTNGGGNWFSINAGLTSTDVTVLAIDPTTSLTLYAGTRWDGGVFKSTNGGGNWNTVNTGLTNTQITSLAIDPVTPTTLYVGTWGGGVFKSTNGGGNWIVANTGLTTTYVIDLAIDPVTPTTLYVGTWDSGVFKSMNGSESWSEVNTGLIDTHVYALAIDPETSTTLYAGTYSGGVFKSTNGGGNWNAVNTGLTATYVPALAIDPVTPSTIYAGTYNGVFRSTNGGENWNVMNAGLTNTRVNVLAIDPITPAFLYAGTDGGGVFAMRVMTPPANVTIYGSTTGIPNSTYTFTAGVRPITTTIPVTYVWKATEQSPITITANLTSAVAFSWNTDGEKVINVTAENAAGMVSVTHVMTLDEPYHIYLPMVVSPSLVEVTAGPTLQFPRVRHTATRLLNGKILIVGGSQDSDDFLAEVELFDPVTGLSSQVAGLHTPRHDHTATLLPDGRVLIVGGYTLPQQWLSDAEVYDPVANTWTVVPPLHKHGVQHTASLLQDGRVLVVGGCIGSSLCTDRVDIFNYQTNAWSEALPLLSDRAAHTAQLLNDGRVLVAGGGRGIDNVPLGGDALLYDPQANTWTATGSMVTMRLAARAVRLADGRVLVVSGVSTENPAVPTLSATAEVYNPTSNTWTSVAALSQGRYDYNLVSLGDGKVLAVGGARDPGNIWNANAYVSEIEIYDPLTNDWHVVGNLPEPRVNAAAALLPDGCVWVTGGRYMATHWSDTWLIGTLAP